MLWCDDNCLLRQEITWESSRTGWRRFSSPRSSRNTISISRTPLGSMMWKALALLSVWLEYKQFSHTKAGRRDGSLRFLKKTIVTVYYSLMHVFHKEYTNQNLGDSSPVSSSPRTPCLNVVSNIPAVWYLSENALSLGKNPICRLLMMRKSQQTQNFQHYNWDNSSE